MSTTHPDPITVDYSTLTDALAPWLERRIRVEVICTSHGDPEWPVARFDGVEVGDISDIDTADLWPPVLRLVRDGEPVAEVHINFSDDRPTFTLCGCPAGWLTLWQEGGCIRIGPDSEEELGLGVD